MIIPNPPNEKDILIMQGSRFLFVVDVSVEWIANLTGYDARGMIRPDRSSSAALLADLEAFMTVDVPNHQVVLDLPADTSSAYDFDTGQYDIEVFVPGDATKTVRVMQGKVSLNRETTR